MVGGNKARRRKIWRIKLEERGKNLHLFSQLFSSLLCCRDVSRGREVKNCGQSFNYPLCIDTGKKDFLH